MDNETMVQGVISLADDMNIIAEFIRDEGRFVGGEVHVPIRHLAKCIRAASKPGVEVVTLKQLKKNVDAQFKENMTVEDYLAEVFLHLASYPNGLKVEG